MTGLTCANCCFMYSDEDNPHPYCHFVGYWYDDKAPCEYDDEPEYDYEQDI